MTANSGWSPYPDGKIEREPEPETWATPKWIVQMASPPCRQRYVRPLPSDLNPLVYGRERVRFENPPYTARGEWGPSILEPLIQRELERIRRESYDYGPTYAALLAETSERLRLAMEKFHDRSARCELVTVRYFKAEDRDCRACVLARRMHDAGDEDPKCR